jgi:hypothetical protein
MTQKPIEDGSFSARREPITLEATRLGLRICLLVVVWVLFVNACCAPAFHRVASGGAEFHMPARDCPGWEALLFGWTSIWPIPWSANVFLLLGSVALLINRVKTAAVLGVIAALASAWTWFVIDRQYLLRGSYIWAASHVTFAGGALVFLFASLIKKHPDQKR